MYIAHGKTRTYFVGFHPYVYGQMFVGRMFVCMLEHHRKYISLNGSLSRKKKVTGIDHIMFNICLMENLKYM